MSGPDPAALARLLRQRKEMGLPPLVLGESDREAFLAAVEALASSRASQPSSPAPSPAPTPPEPRSRGERMRERTPAPPPKRPPAPVSEGPAPSSPAASNGELPVLSDLGYDELKELALACTRCGLAEGRTQVVFSDGNPHARLVVVGEAPGANEDRTGLPFVGRAGQLLDLMLASVDLSRKESVYIANVLKCRPPGNRNPEKDEISACSPFLHRQLELVRPQALLAVGSFAGQLLTSSDQPLGKLRGQVHSYQGIPLVVTYHPAALLRNRGWTRAAWDDLQLLRQVMD